MKKQLMAVAVVALLAATAYAASLEPPTLSGTVFADVRYDLTKQEESWQEGGTDFDLGRCYINVKGSLFEKLAYRVTTDISRTEDTYYTYELVPSTEIPGEYTLEETKHTKKGPYGLILKYAYFDVKDVIPQHDIYGGMVKTPWIDYEQDIWGWRVIRKPAFDDRGFGSSADLGVGVGGRIANGLLEHHLTATNGSGYKDPEEPLSGKDAEYRLSVFPLLGNESFQGLSVNGVVKAGNLGEKVAEGEAKDPVMIYGGLLGFKHPFVNFGAGYFTRSEGEDNTTAGTEKVQSNLMTAYSTGHFSLADGAVTVHTLVRYDMYDPDKNTSDDERTLLIGGVGVKFFEDTLALIPNYQTESYKELNASGQLEDKSIDYVYLHCQWDWK